MKIRAHIQTSVFKVSTGWSWLNSIQLKVSTNFCITILSGTWSNDFNPSTPKIKTGSITPTQYRALNPKQMFYDSMSYFCFLDQVGKGFKKSFSQLFLRLLPG